MRPSDNRTERAPSNRATVARALILASLVTAIRADIAFAQERAGCNRQTVAMVMSPDDTWAALVQEDICSDGAFVTVATDVVQLVPRGAKPRDEDNIFAIDEHGRPENRPLLRWLSPRKLQISVPNKSLIALQKSSHEDIDIVIKFDPDDPIERQQFLRQFRERTK